jgi:hypothetical protein
MKNWQITVFLTILILGFTLMSGCISSATSNTAPVLVSTTPTPITSIPTSTITPELTPLIILESPSVTITANITQIPITIVPTTEPEPEILDPDVLIFKTYTNEYYSILYPEQWTVIDENSTSSTIFTSKNATIFTSKNNQINYTLTTTYLGADSWYVKSEPAPFLKDVKLDYPEYLPENIMRDLGHCSVSDTRSCTQYSVYLPDGSYSKKFFIVTLHFIYEFRIQCPNDSCKNLGIYMTNSIKVKDTKCN